MLNPMQLFLPEQEPLQTLQAHKVVCRVMFPVHTDDQVTGVVRKSSSPLCAVANSASKM